MNFNLRGTSKEKRRFCERSPAVLTTHFISRQRDNIRITKKFQEELSIFLEIILRAKYLFKK